MMVYRLNPVSLTGGHADRRWLVGLTTAVGAQDNGQLTWVSLHQSKPGQEVMNPAFFR